MTDATLNFNTEQMVGQVVRATKALDSLNAAVAALNGTGFEKLSEKAADSGKVISTYAGTVKTALQKVLSDLESEEKYKLNVVKDFRVRTQVEYESGWIAKKALDQKYTLQELRDFKAHHAALFVEDELRVKKAQSLAESQAI